MLIVATPDWEEAALEPTVIDVDEFEAALNDPVWRAFCEAADQYYSSSTSA